MKTPPYFLLLVNAILAVGLTVLSFQYVQPKNCYNFCDPSYGIPCPKGSCYFGDQKAGWPIPAFVDSPGGGSPTGGWGLLGPEDPPGPTMIVDVLFYSILVWIALYVIQAFRHEAFSQKLLLRSLALNTVLGLFLWIFYFVFTFTMGFHGIGRGYRVSVYVKTSTDVDLHSAMTFAPTISIPLDEVIEYFGDPDYAGLLRIAPRESQQLDCCFIGIRSQCSLNCLRLGTTPILSTERRILKGSFFR